MSDPKVFMAEQGLRCDAVLLEVRSAPEPQHRLARVLEVFSARHGVSGEMQGKEIRFIHAPSTWGNNPIKVGDTALVFLRSIGGRFYECDWNGHFLLENQDGQRFVVYKYPELWLSEEVPSSLREYIRPDALRPKASLVQLDALIRYLRSLRESG